MKRILQLFLFKYFKQLLNKMLGMLMWQGFGVVLGFSILLSTSLILTYI